MVLQLVTNFQHKPDRAGHHHGHCARKRWPGSALHALSYSSVRSSGSKVRQHSSHVHVHQPAYLSICLVISKLPGLKDCLSATAPLLYDAQRVATSQYCSLFARSTHNVRKRG